MIAMKELSIDLIKGVTVTLANVGESWILEWGDCVANVETETYGSLSSALARVALLASCAESGWVDTFADDEGEHIERWSLFEDSALH